MEKIHWNVKLAKTDGFLLLAVNSFLDFSLFRTFHKNWLPQQLVQGNGTVISYLFCTIYFSIQIQNAQADEDLHLTESELLLLTEAGFANEIFTVANKYRACQCLMTHLVFRARREEIDQMRDGMESVSLI